MRSSGIQRVQQKISEMDAGERRLLYGYLVKIWKLTVPGYMPSVAISGYAPDKPLLGFLDLLLQEEREQVMRELCAQTGRTLPQDIPAAPEIRALALV